jgi:hypothetical protein
MRALSTITFEWPVICRNRCQGRKSFPISRLALRLVGTDSHIPTWIVGSGEARLRASLRPPLKLHVRFSRMQLFTKTRDLRGKEKATAKWTFLTSVRLRPASSILGR